MEKTASVKSMGNGRVRFNRVIANIFRVLFLRERKLATVDELKADDLFAGFNKQKAKIAAIIERQENAIKEREAIASKITKDTDNEVADLKKEIAQLQADLQKRLADEESAKAAILAEKERVEVLGENIEKFLTIKL